MEFTGNPVDSRNKLLKIGSRRTVTIERLSLGGDGVARTDEGVLFVPYAAPGDTLEVEITETRDRFARAYPVRVIEQSPERITPACPYHFQLNKQQSLFCGGCTWQHLTYDAQLRAKTELVRETLERIGGVKGVRVNPTIGMKDPWRYRNKVQQPVGWDGKRLVTGFYAPGSHDIMPIEDCLVQPELSVAIVNRARALLERYGVRAYDEDRRTGWLRHLLVRTTQNATQALLAFVTYTPDFPHEREIVQTLVTEFPALAGIHQNINPAHTNVILGRRWRSIAGAETIEERLGTLRFLLSPGSFFQVNTVQAKVLYDVVKKAARGDLLLDLYCGVGSIALYLAPQFKAVLGVEEVESAARDAEKNARLNNIRNARFIGEPTERFMRSGIDRPASGKLTVVNPPRAGCSKEVVQGILQLRPHQLIYVSCDPGTLARDTALLTRGGYRVEDVQPVDLFPHTSHIETVISFSHP